VSRQIVFCK